MGKGRPPQKFTVLPLSPKSEPHELHRRHHLFSGQFHTWTKQYPQIKLDSESSRKAELAARVKELERLFGKLTLENEFLKKP